MSNGGHGRLGCYTVLTCCNPNSVLAGRGISARLRGKKHMVFREDGAIFLFQMWAGRRGRGAEGDTQEQEALCEAKVKLGTEG
jgi:hypothetical protein